MEKCYFEVGKTYLDEYRKEFKITEVRPHFPYRSTFDNEIIEMSEGGENYYDIFTDKSHSPFWGEEYPEKYESFAQGSFAYNKLVAINEHPEHKEFICVVPGAHVICDSHEYDPETRDYMEYAMVGHGFKDFFHMDKLTKDEKKQVEDWAERIYKELND